jgi:hypothetical protein
MCPCRSPPTVPAENAESGKSASGAPLIPRVPLSLPVLLVRPSFFAPLVPTIAPRGAPAGRPGSPIIGFGLPVAFLVSAPSGASFLPVLLAPIVPRGAPAGARAPEPGGRRRITSILALQWRAILRVRTNGERAPWGLGTRGSGGGRDGEAKGGKNNSRRYGETSKAGCHARGGRKAARERQAIRPDLRGIGANRPRRIRGSRARKS